MEAASEFAALKIPPEEICVIHPGPTKRWLSAKQKWDVKYAKEKRHVQLSRGKEYINAQKRGFLGGDLIGEMPPPSALAGRPSVQKALPEDETGKKKKNLAGWVWGMMGGKEDREKEERNRKVAEGDDHVTPAAAAGV